MKYLVDTNVFSEQMKPKPNPAVLSWLKETPKYQIYTSIFVIGEIRKGGDIITAKKHPKAPLLNAWLVNDRIPWFDSRLLEGTLAIAQKWGILRASKPQFKDIDAILAATCLGTWVYLGYA